MPCICGVACRSWFSIYGKLLKLNSYIISEHCKSIFPFHLKKLIHCLLRKRLKKLVHLERLDFFKQLCFENNYQAVILGHHADDQSETILKKVLEGSSLPYLCGMTPTSVYQGLHLWRPLLDYSKTDIKKWLKEKEVSALKILRI